MQIRLLKELDDVRQDMIKNGNPQIANIIERAIEEILHQERRIKRLDEEHMPKFTEIK